MDPKQRIQSLLQFEEICCTCIRGDLVKHSSRTKCLVAHITRIGDNALLVYQDPVGEITKYTTLNLLYALAIRGPFSLTGENDGSSNKNGNQLRFQVITDDNVKYVFEVNTSENSLKFLLDVKNAITAYRQKAHMIGFPDFKWLERYQQQISRKSFDVPADWVLKHLMNQDEMVTCTAPTIMSIPSTSTVPAITTAQSDDGLDAFGMPGFNPTDTILHPSPSAGSLKSLDKTDHGSASASPLFPRKSVLPSNFGTRDGFIRLHMAAREADYLNVLPFKFFIGTWNVNGKSPSENLAPWIMCDEEPPDIVVAGFQELDLSAEALIMSNVTSSSSSTKEEDWQRAVEKALRGKTTYTKVRSIRLVGIFLLVYAKSTHMPHIKEVDAEYVATGIMGMMGNKGGVSIRMEFHNTTMCFVNSHLAAHQEEYERRNQDYRDIMNKLMFTRVAEVLSILDHDITFWLGDLNYRVSNLDCEQSKLLIEKGRLDKLLESDQLLRQKELENCFTGFSEAPITFIPTYKYDPGTDNWDSSEKGRAPAWCDRVLYRGKNVKPIAYRSHPRLKLSDHKPVSGLFGVGVKVVDREKEKQVYEDVVRTLDRQENESLPQVKLSTTELKFKNVQFLEKMSKVVEIENTGQVPVQFSFICKLDDSHFCKPWLNVKPHIGIIMPDNTKQVKVTTYINKETAGALNSGDDKMEDILVLHLEGGKDFFITVTGNYVPSVFGSSLEALIHMYGPIREVPVDNLIDLEHGQDSSGSSSQQSRDKEALEIPKELWLLVDHLYKYGSSEENILKQSGFETEIQEIRTHLDTGNTGKMPGGIHSVAEALLIFLEALPVPVIPFGFYNKALEGCNNYILCKQLIYQLPECHRNVFTYLTAFLRELLLSSAENRLDAKTLATLFGTLFLRAPKDTDNPALSKRAVTQLTQKKARFVYHFLINEFGALEK